MARPAGSASLAIDAGARGPRRSVGLTARIALEELLLDAAPQPSGSLSTQLSARVLAARLGVSKDTAAAALGRLASAGLVRREDHRDAARGVFARSVYVMDATRLDEHGVRRHPAQPLRPTRRGAASVAARRRDGQASLFDPATVDDP